MVERTPLCLGRSARTAQNRKQESAFFTIAEAGQMVVRVS
jgi:hypothetical protein